MKRLFKLLLTLCVLGASVKTMASDVSSAIPKMNGMVVSSASGTVTPGLWALPSSPSDAWSMNFEMPPGYASFYGGVLYDNVYYATRVNAQYGTVVYVDAYSMEDGTKLWTNYPDITALPYDLTLNPYDGKIYGFFSNKKNTGMVLATITYGQSGETVTPIKEMEGVWVAIAADASGQLYGISSDVEIVGTSAKVNSSSLHKIDRLTGETTLIGETGQLPLITGSATIDARSGRMFWTVGPGDEQTFLCEVDLTTGVATRVMDFDQGQQVVGLYVPTPPAEDDAPAEVTDVVATFDGGSLSGSLQFKAPTTLYDGTPASGPLTYTVLLDGIEQVTGETSFGATVSTDVTVPERGNYEFTVSVANDKGSSPKVSVDRFIGFGTPVAPENVKAEKGSDKIKVSWDAVTASSDGGYVDAAAVTYTVKRMPGNVVVAENTTATSVEDTPDVSGGMASFSYVVSADNHGCVSATAESNRVVCGTASLPWQENFAASESFNFFTVIDGNDDGKTWEYASGLARVKYGKVKMDDWLISPPLQLEAGKVYQATFKAHSSNARFPEAIEAKWGAGNTVADMTNTLVEPTTLSGDYETLGGFIKPAVSGVYYLGLHVPKIFSSDFLKKNAVAQKNDNIACVLLTFHNTLCILFHKLPCLGGFGLAFGDGLAVFVGDCGHSRHIVAVDLCIVFKAFLIEEGGTVPVGENGKSSLCFVAYLCFDYLLGKAQLVIHIGYDTQLYCNASVVHASDIRAVGNVNGCYKLVAALVEKLHHFENSSVLMLVRRGVDISREQVGTGHRTRKIVKPCLWLVYFVEYLAALAYEINAAVGYEICGRHACFNIDDYGVGEGTAELCGLYVNKL